MERQEINVDEMRAKILGLLEQDASNAMKVFTTTLVMSMTRGNNIEKIARTCKPESVPDLLKAQKTLQLVSKANGDPKAITLSRFALCFPRYVIMLSSLCKPGLVNFCIPNEFPYCMRNNCFAQMLPEPQGELLTKANLRKLFNAYVMYCAYASYAYRGRAGDEPDIDSVKEQQSRCALARNKSTCSQESKVDLLLKTDAFVSTEEISEGNTTTVKHLSPGVEEMNTRYERIIKSQSGSTSSL